VSGISICRIKNMRGSVYELLDPRDGSCRYVGMTFNVAARERSHADSRSFQWSLSDWKCELNSIGLRPVMRVIESGIKAEDILERERHWCRERVSSGARLLNKPAGRITRSDLFSPSDSLLISEVCDQMQDLISIVFRYGSSLPKNVEKAALKARCCTTNLKHSLPGW
jgi:hypothetical protein